MKLESTMLQFAILSPCRASCNICRFPFPLVLTMTMNPSSKWRNGLLFFLTFWLATEFLQTYVWSTTSKPGPSKESLVEPFAILGNQLRCNPWWIWGIWSYLLTLSVYRSIGPTSSKIFQGIQQKLQQQHPFPWHSMATLLKQGGMICANVYIYPSLENIGVLYIQTYMGK